MRPELWEILTAPGMLLVWGMVVVLVTLIVLVTKFAPEQMDPVRTPGYRHLVQDATGIRCPRRRLVMWEFLVWTSAVLCLLAGVMLNVEHIKNGNRQSPAGWLLIATFLLIAILMANLRRLAYIWIYQKLLCGNYDAALARADRVLRWLPEAPMLHFMRGTVLLYAGRLVESEQSLRTCLEKGQIQASAIQPIALTSLGSVLLHLGRFPRATACLEAATKIAPRNAEPYSVLAQVLLRQGLEPRRALLLAENALQLKQHNIRTRNLDRHSRANMWATKAQALAMLGQKDEASSAIVTAGEVGDPEFIPGLAGTYWRCGVAFRLMDQEQSALEQFQKAIEIDPHGLYGQFAAAATQEQPAHH